MTAGFWFFTGAVLLMVALLVVLMIPWVRRKINDV